jgi:hypothetical protein
MKINKGDGIMHTSTQKKICMISPPLLPEIRTYLENNMHRIPAVIYLFFLCIPVTIFAGPPFRTDDPQPVDFHHWEFYLASQQQYIKTESDATCPHIEVNYGIVSNVQLHLVAPVGYVHTADGTHFGYSDTELGVKYRFAEETEKSPQIGVFPLIEIPTGNKNDQLGTGTVRVFVPVWIQKSWGQLTTYGGGGYWYNPGDGQKNWGFAGWELQYDFSEFITIGGELFYQTADSRNSEATGGFNVGGFINLDDSHHILFSLGHDLTGTMTTTAYVGFLFTL